MYEIRTKCYMLHHVTYIIATYCRLGINAAGSAISCLQLEIQGWQIGIKMVLQSWTVKWPYFIILPACCGVISFKWHWIICRDCYLSSFERERECMRVRHGVVLGETFFNMATGTLPICRAALYKELTARNTTSRKWRTEEWWLGNCSTAWHWTLLCRRKCWFLDMRTFVVDCSSC